MDKLLLELHMCELNILKEFIHICEENRLQYYLGYGTCLGAVRHKGFIPWDDDIDVLMPRKDFNRFLDIAQEALPAYYFLQTICTDDEYLGNLAKIRDNRTTFIESSVKDRKINHGVYMDIFPLDYYPEKHSKLFDMKELLYVARISKAYSSKASSKMSMLQKVAVLLMPNLRKTILKRDNHMQSVKSSRFLTSYCSGYDYKKELLNPDCYGKGVDAEFEGITVKIPSRYDDYLTKLYGDYMTPVPPEKQEGHHFAEIIDFSKPYTYYTNQ